MVLRTAYLHLTLARCKVIHISTANISKMVKDRANITIAFKYEVAHRHSISICRVDLDPF